MNIIALKNADFKRKLNLHKKFVTKERRRDIRAASNKIKSVRYMQPRRSEQDKERAENLREFT